jgi:putative redox protein
MDFARVRWTGRRQFVGTDESGHSIVMDSKPEYHGEGSGIRPIEVVLHGLAACTGMDVISILEKKRQDVRAFEINVRAEQRTEDFPRIYTRIDLEYVVTGFGVNPDAVARAIALSEEKYCSVGGMLGDQVSLSTSYRVIEASQPGRPTRASEEEGEHE